MAENEEQSKYVHLGRGYDKDWFFMKDDKELEECKKDYSFDEDDYIVEIKRIFKIKKNVIMELEEIPKEKS